MSQRIVDTNKGPCSCAGGKGNDRDYPTDPDDAQCTDVFCLLFIAIYWVGILGVGVSSISTGDLTALWYGADYLGNRCGVGIMEDKKDVWCASARRCARVCADDTPGHADAVTAARLYARAPHAQPDQTWPS